MLFSVGAMRLQQGFKNIDVQANWSTYFGVPSSGQGSKPISASNRCKCAWARGSIGMGRGGGGGGGGMLLHMLAESCLKLRLTIV